MGNATHIPVVRSILTPEALTALVERAYQNHL